MKPVSHIAVLWDKCSIPVFLVFINDEVAFRFDSFFAAVLPSDKTESKLCNNLMVALPRFKVECTPHSLFFTPKIPYTFKQIPAGGQSRIGALEALIDFVNFLRKGKVGATTR